MLLWYIGITAPREKGIRMMLYRFEVDYTVPGKMGNKNYVTAVAATDAAHARVEAGKIFEGLKEDYVDDGTSEEIECEWSEVPGDWRGKGDPDYTEEFREVAERELDGKERHMVLSALVKKG